MNKLKIVIVILLAFCTHGSFATENNIMFENANQLYHNRNYDSAAQLYQQMIEDGYCHPDLYYNAGNAYYRSNQVGMSVWCFKKALLIENKKNYRDNLVLAQKKIERQVSTEEEIFFLRWWKNVYNVMSLNLWAITTLLLFLMSIMLLVMRNIFNKNRVSKNSVKILVVFTCFSLLFLGVKFYHEDYRYHGIIVEKNTEFKSTSKSLSTTLSEGIEVEFISKKNNRLLVKLPDGRVGEIKESAFRKL